MHRISGHKKKKDKSEAVKVRISAFRKVPLDPREWRERLVQNRLQLLSSSTRSPFNTIVLNDLSKLGLESC